MNHIYEALGSLVQRVLKFNTYCGSHLGRLEPWHMSSTITVVSKTMQQQTRH